MANYVSSYIPTLGASVTRSADAASKTGISSLIGQTSGTIFVDADINNFTSPSGNWHALMVGTQAERITIFTSGGQTISVDGVGIGGGFAEIPTALTLGRNKAAIAYAPNDVAFYLNGVLIGTRTTAAIPSGMAQIDVGGNFTYLDYMAGNRFNAVALYPVRLSNAELQTLTTL